MCPLRMEIRQRQAQIMMAIKSDVPPTNNASAASTRWVPLITGCYPPRSTRRSWTLLFMRGRSDPILNNPKTSYIFAFLRQSSAMPCERWNWPLRKVIPLSSTSSSCF